MAVITVTKETSHEGKLRMPHILVVDAHPGPHDFLITLAGRKKPIIFNGCEIVPVLHVEKDAPAKIESPFAVALKEKNKDFFHTMDINEIVSYAQDPANKIDGVLTYYQKGGEAPGWLLARELASITQPLAIQTEGNIMDDKEASMSIARLNGAIGMYFKNDMASADPKISGLAALKQAIMKNRELEN